MSVPYGILPMEAASPRRNRPLLRRSGEAPTAKRSSVGALLKTVTAAAQHVPETHGILSVSRLKKSGPPEHIMSAQDKMRQAIARYHGMLPLSPRKEEAAKTISSSLGVQATIDAKVPLPPTAYLDDLGLRDAAHKSPRGRATHLTAGDGVRQLLVEVPYAVAHGGDSGTTGSMADRLLSSSPRSGNVMVNVSHRRNSIARVQALQQSAGFGVSAAVSGYALQETPTETRPTTLQGLPASSAAAHAFTSGGGGGGGGGGLLWSSGWERGTVATSSVPVPTSPARSPRAFSVPAPALGAGKPSTLAEVTTGPWEKRHFYVPHPAKRRGGEDVASLMLPEPVEPVPTTSSPRAGAGSDTVQLRPATAAPTLRLPAPDLFAGAAGAPSGAALTSRLTHSSPIIAEAMGFGGAATRAATAEAGGRRGGSGLEHVPTHRAASAAPSPRRSAHYSRDLSGSATVLALRQDLDTGAGPASRVRRDQQSHVSFGSGAAALLAPDAAGASHFATTYGRAFSAGHPAGERAGRSSVGATTRSNERYAPTSIY